MRQVLADKKTAKELEQHILRAFTNDEMNEITAFLLRQHTDVQAKVEPPPVLAAVAPGPTPPSPPQPPAFTPPPADLQPSSGSTAHACRHCSGQDVEILYGQYGYYFKCRSCSQNTPIDFKCESCGKKAKISKSGKDFTRKCANCNTEAPFFTNPEQL